MALVCVHKTEACSVLKHLGLHGPGLPLGHTNITFLKVIGEAKFKLVYKCTKKKASERASYVGFSV